MEAVRKRHRHALEPVDARALVHSQKNPRAFGFGSIGELQKRPPVTFPFLLVFPSLASAQSSLTSSSPSHFTPKPPAVSHSTSGGTIQGSRDACSTPVAISGQSTLAYDTTGATTGTEDQNACWGINDYERFLWTTDASGIAAVSTCSDGHDTKLPANSDAGGCPADGTSLDCTTTLAVSSPSWTFRSPTARVT